MIRTGLAHVTGNISPLEGQGAEGAKGARTAYVQCKPSTKDTEVIHGCHRSILTDNKEVLCHWTQEQP